MTTFISVCLYVFAGCAALGLLPAVVLAAGAHQLAMMVLSSTPIFVSICSHAAAL